MKGISVIIPVFNQEKFIAQAIESVLSQNYNGRIEIIISDDGSTDESMSIAESYLPNVIIIRKSENCKTQGVSGARNRGLQAATQDYICFLDSDDFYLPDHLIKIYSLIENSSLFGFAFSRMLEIQNIEDTIKYREWTQQKITKNDIINPVLSRNHIVHTNTLIFKREVFMNVGMFNEDYSNGEDGDLWMRISELYKGCFSDHFGAVYRTNHSLSQLTKNNNEILRICEIEIYKSALKRYYSLRLRNPYRLFKIKQTLLYLNNDLSKFKYYLEYFLLMLSYPFQFIKDRYYSFLQYKFTWRNQSWKDFTDFTNITP
jgi:glycosyltransferase involved in cell wall biosynthesis